MIHIGTVIYFWGESEQRRLLTDGLRFWALEARQLGLAERFCYCRSDIRGPHIFAVFDAQEDQEAAICKLLREQIAFFLGRAPSMTELIAEQLRRRHEACRGKTMCQLDRESGLAANNTFRLFRHVETDYLGSRATPFDRDGRFRSALSALTFWTLERMAGGQLLMLNSSVGWLKAVDRAVDQWGFSAEDYWRFHAGTLIPHMDLHAESNRREVAAVLHRAISERSRAAIETLWAASEMPQPEVNIPSFVSWILEEDGRSIDQRFRLLREVNHLILGQLGLPVDRQIPMVLYAWQRRLAQ